ncbi:MAG: transposase [Saprospiraceae bacterium]
MGGHKITSQQGLHFLTFTVVGWVDVFTHRAYRDIVIDSLKYCVAEKELNLYAYVIMSNHVHIIASTENKDGLSAVLRDFKTFTSKKIVKAIQENNQESRREWMLRMFRYYASNNTKNTEFQFWKQDNHPVELASPEWILQRLQYIHNNPVVAGIVDEPSQYLYSSARNYLGQKGLIDVEILDFSNDVGFVYLG